MDNLQELKNRMANWADDDYEEDLGDLLHVYFEATKMRDWVDIANEARDLWKFLFKEEVEMYSPIDELLSAVAAQAAEGIYAAVASALDLNPKYLRYVIAPWEEDIKGNDAVPAPITFTELKKRLKQEQKEWEELYGNN